MSLQYHIRSLCRSVDDFAAAVALRLLRWSQRKSNMLAHAKYEWSVTFPAKDDDEYEMQRLVGESIFDVVAAFAASGHSGFSAGYTVPFIQHALRFEPLSPLTGEEHEWVRVSDDYWQNRRCGRVFRELDGRAYDIDGRVFVDKDGIAYTNYNSRVYIEFPYTPTTEYVHDAKED